MGARFLAYVFAGKADEAVYVPSGGLSRRDQK
jgi:hypothetical protein